MGGKSSKRKSGVSTPRQAKKTKPKHKPLHQSLFDDDSQVTTSITWVERSSMRQSALGGAGKGDNDTDSIRDKETDCTKRKNDETDASRLKTNTDENNT